jgi:hypothetical protein
MKNIVPKKKNTNMKDLLFKDLLKKYKWWFKRVNIYKTNIIFFLKSIY